MRNPERCLEFIHHIKTFHIRHIPYKDKNSSTALFFIYFVGPKAAVLNCGTSKEITCMIKEYSSEIVKMSSTYTYINKGKGFSGFQVVEASFGKAVREGGKQKLLVKFAIQIEVSALSLDRGLLTVLRILVQERETPL